MQRLAKKLDIWAAIPMTGAAWIFALCLAGLLHFEDLPQYRPLITACQWGLCALWPLFLAELLLHLAAGNSYWKQNLVFCLAPPLRLGARDHVTGSHIWLPGWGWRLANRELRQELERALSIPMVGVALMVLPIMGLEQLGLKATTAATSAEGLEDGDTQLASETTPAAPLAAEAPAPSWSPLIPLGTGLIWLAFTAEFVIMISVVDRKIAYCKEHWIDLAVICLPLIAFLRVARLGRLLRLQQLSRTARVYRLRGLLMRTYRAVIVLDLLERLLRVSPEKRLARLHEKRQDKEQELEEIRREIREVELELANQVPTPRQAA